VLSFAPPELSLPERLIGSIRRECVDYLWCSANSTCAMSFARMPTRTMKRGHLAR
jgi:hypothetical protein